MSIINLGAVPNAIISLIPKTKTKKKFSQLVVETLYPSLKTGTPTEISAKAHVIQAKAKKGKKQAIQFTGVATALLGAVTAFTPASPLAIPIITAGVTAFGAPATVEKILSSPALSTTALAGVTGGITPAVIVGGEQGVNILRDTVGKDLITAGTGALAGAGLVVAGQEALDKAKEFFQDENIPFTNLPAPPIAGEDTPTMPQPSAINPTIPSGSQAEGSTPKTKRRKSRLKAQGQKISQRVDVRVGVNAGNKKYIKMAQYK